MIKAALSQEPNMSIDPSKFTLGFESLSKFLNTYFPSILELEKAELYRKAWMISGGAVDIDGILTAINEENFFARILVSATFRKLSLLQMNVDTRSKEQTDVMCKALNKTFIQLTHNFEVLKESAWEAGIETVTADLQSYEEDLMKGLDDQAKKGNENQMYSWLYSLNCHIMKINQMSTYLDYPDTPKEIQARTQKR